MKTLKLKEVKTLSGSIYLLDGQNLVGVKAKGYVPELKDGKQTGYAIRPQTGKVCFGEPKVGNQLVIDAGNGGFLQTTPVAEIGTVTISEDALGV